MQYLIFGGTGFLGQHLGQKISSDNPNTKIIVVSRKPSQYKGYLSYPCEIVSLDRFLEKPASIIDRPTHVINLSGAGVMDKRWNSSYKQILRNSRIDFSKKIIEATESISQYILSWVQASGIGYYGNVSKKVTENSPAGKSFLAQLSVEWEDTLNTLPRTIPCSAIIRLGMVLGRSGGPFPILADVYHLGLGAKFGSGKQHLAWIHIQDAVDLFLHASKQNKRNQVYNGCSPESTLQKDFHLEMTKASGRINPTILPKFIARIVMGENAELVYSGQNAQPENAVSSGFKFTHTKISNTLKNIYGKAYKQKNLILELHQWLPKNQGEVWDFFSDEMNLEKITPAQLNFKVLGKSTNNIETGTLIDYKLKLHGIPVKWRTKITDWEPVTTFVDMQLKGPYKKWHHTHEFKKMSEGTLMVDRVLYKLPLGWIGAFFGYLLIKWDLKKIFEYRRKASKDFFSK